MSGDGGERREPGNAEDTMQVKVHDETADQYILMNLTPSQIERANNDSHYLDQLIIEYRAEEAAALTQHTPEDQNLQISEIQDENQPNQPTSSLFIWNNACVHLLLTLYEEYKEKFNSMRHKKVYELIASDMKRINPLYTVTGGQCQSKLNGLKKTYKKIKDHNTTSGNDRASWPYFDRMQEIFGTCRWVDPLATASEAGPSESLTEVSVPKPPVKKRKFDAIYEDFVKERKRNMEERISLKRELGERMLLMKERHHKEKMEVLKSLCNIINSRVNN